MELELKSFVDDVGVTHKTLKELGYDEETEEEPIEETD